MSARRSEEQCRQAFEAWIRNGRSRKQAAAELKIASGTFDKALEDYQARFMTQEDRRLLAQQGEMPPGRPVPDGLTLKGTSTLYDAAGNVEKLWNKTKVQGREAENTVQLPDPKKITKASTLYDNQGLVTMQWVTEKPEDQERERLWIEFAKSLAADLPVLPPIALRATDCSDDLMNFIPWGDPHFGMYSWAAETGNDFDLEIARRDLCAAVAYLVSQAPPAKRCLIGNLGDFWHTDNLEGVTPTHRHSLDRDSRLAKVIAVGAAAHRQAIETALERHEIVEIAVVPGNHDPVLALAVSVMLGQLYRDNPRVVIHDQPTLRRYVRHGKVLVGMVHGDRTKDRDLPGIMATERPEEWGATRFRHWFRGHHHQDAKEEFNGCTVEQVRTLAPGDAWAVGGGYLSGRDMKLITFHAEHGEVARITCSIDLLRKIQAAA